MPAQSLAYCYRKIIACALFFTICAAHAAPLVVVPPGLNTGDEYRLAFLTQGWTSGSASTTPGTGIRDALATDINDYNAWVTSYAEHDPFLDNLGTTWAAIASTETVDARDNTGTNPALASGVP
ncbi:MAG: hypothetical protein HKO07_07010, partial [Pseudomonadales bacterium]|nr:hypothetical protein [Pseudomonadales bacterium]